LRRRKRQKSKKADMKTVSRMAWVQIFHQLCWKWGAVKLARDIPNTATAAVLVALIAELFAGAGCSGSR
jgi:hypothetical protein